MPEPTTTYAAGDEVKAADINTNFIEALNDYRDFTLGENISALTPVYIKASDGKIYKSSSSANDEKIHSFVGFLMETGVTNDVKKVQVSGKVVSLSGLTAGSKVFLKDTAGTYGTTIGTQEKIIGVAVLTTSLILRVQVEGALTQIAQNITGIKSFLSFPLTPSSDPSNAYEVANKQYIDNNPITKNFVTATKNPSDANATQTIAHGLGRTPKLVRITASMVSGSGSGTESCHSYGIWKTGNTYACQWYTMIETNVRSAVAFDSTSYVVSVGQVLSDGSNAFASATVTVDGTNVYLAWTKTQSPSSNTAHLTIEVE